VAIDFTLGIRAGNGGGQATVEQGVDAGEIGVRFEFVRQRTGANELEEFGLDFLRRDRREDAGLEGMPATGIQKTQGGEAVEPSVGDTLDEGGAVFRDILAQCGDLIGGLAKIRRVGGEHVVELARDGLHELPPDGGGEGLESGGVHGKVAIKLGINVALQESGLLLGTQILEQSG